MQSNFIRNVKIPLNRKLNRNCEIFSSNDNRVLEIEVS